ncbi:Atpase, vacuolar er assembly factor, vma12, partial [Globisporangium splendens]
MEGLDSERSFLNPVFGGRSQNEKRMGYVVELQGDGVRALRAYIAQHVHDAKELKALGKQDATALTTLQLRHAAALLRRLRDEQAETPTIASFFKQSGDSNARVDVAVLNADDPSVPESEVAKEQSAYLERRRKRLLRLDEEMRYGRLVRNVQKKSNQVEFAQHQKSVQQHLSIGANMIAARVTAFVAMYILARTLTDNETTRVIVGLAGAIGMMFIEMVLFITRSAKYEIIEKEQARQRPSVF